jgi:hypothetical protein
LTRERTALRAVHYKPDECAVQKIMHVLLTAI